MRRRITFCTRKNCHLCDSARYVLERAIAERDDVTVEYVDIDGDPSLGHYNDHVPVILLDGVELARHRLDPDVIAAALKRREA
jgi:glutaredoxin